MAEDRFRHLLRKEFDRRVAKNPSYSLRAYASFLGVYHGSLSGLMSGKRVISNQTLQKLAPKLGVKAEDFLSRKKLPPAKPISRKLLTQDIYNSIADWTYDAILEFALIDDVRLTPESVARYFSISQEQAKNAIAALLRLGLLVQTSDGIRNQQAQSTTNLDSNHKTFKEGTKQYQKNIVKKSLESIDSFDLEERHHRSMTMAIRKEDCLKAKNLIAQFMNDMEHYLQKANSENFDEVYQLQVGFFPLKGTEL